MRRSEIEALLAQGIQVPRGEYDRNAPLNSNSSNYQKNMAIRAGTPIPQAPARSVSGETPSSWGQVSKEETLAKGLRMPTTQEKWKKKRGDRPENFQFPDYSTTEIRDAELANASELMAKGKFKYGGLGSYADTSPEAHAQVEATLHERFGTPDNRFDNKKEAQVRNKRQDSNAAPVYEDSSNYEKNMAIRRGDPILPVSARQQDPKNRDRGR